VSQFEVGFEDIVMEGTDEGCRGAMGVGHSEIVHHRTCSRFFDNSEAAAFQSTLHSPFE